VKTVRLPLLRRISQIFFFLLFLALWDSLLSVPHPAQTADLHMRGPVRLFFEWDPLVALVNALAGHALYRGLLWSLIILIPTLFLGRFLLRLDLSHGHAAALGGSWPSESKTRQTAHRLEPLQALANRQIRGSAGWVDSGGLWLRSNWMAGSLQPAGPLLRAVIAAGLQLRRTRSAHPA